MFCYMKKVFSIVLIMFFGLLIADPTAASASEDLSDLNEVGEIIYQDEEITVRELGNDPEIAERIENHADAEEEILVSPFATGPGGKAVISAGDSGRIIYWTIRPNTAWPYNFTGKVALRYHSGFKRDAPIGGMGMLGSSVSGSVSMNKNNGGYATLSGTAFSLDGKKRSVLPGVGTSF